MSEEKKQTLVEMGKHVFDLGLKTAGEGKYNEAIAILDNLNGMLPIFIASVLQTGRCHWERLS